MSRDKETFWHKHNGVLTRRETHGVITCRSFEARYPGYAVVHQIHQVTTVDGLQAEDTLALELFPVTRPAGESQSLVVPMTIANTVILELVSIDEGRSIRALEAFRAFQACGKLAAAIV